MDGWTCLSASKRVDAVAGVDHPLQLHWLAPKEVVRVEDAQTPRHWDGGAGEDAALALIVQPNTGVGQQENGQVHPVDQVSADLLYSI